MGRRAAGGCGPAKCARFAAPAVILPRRGVDDEVATARMTNTKTGSWRSRRPQRRFRQTEDGGDQGDHEEDDGVVQHDGPLWVGSAAGSPPARRRGPASEAGERGRRDRVRRRSVRSTLRWGGARPALRRPAACDGVALHGLLLCLACGPRTWALRTIPSGGAGGSAVRRPNGAWESFDALLASGGNPGRGACLGHNPRQRPAQGLPPPRWRRFAPFFRFPAPCT